MFSEIRAFFSTAPKYLNWIALLAFVLLVLKIFIANRIPQLFLGAYELGIMVEGVLISVIASCIFYLVVVHTKERRDAKLVTPHIAKWGSLVVRDCKTQLTELSKATDTNLLLDTITEQAVAKALADINPNGEAPMTLGYGENRKANWREYFEHYRIRSKGHIAKLMSQLIFLDSEMVALITKIDDGRHFTFVEMSYGFPMGNKDASVFSEGFFDYCLTCKKLAIYLARHYPSEYEL